MFTNKARKLEVAESNPIMENIPISISPLVYANADFAELVGLATL